jgi:hypothetical protein
MSWSSGIGKPFSCQPEVERLHRPRRGPFELGSRRRARRRLFRRLPSSQLRRKAPQKTTRRGPSICHGFTHSRTSTTSPIPSTQPSAAILPEAPPPPGSQQEPPEVCGSYRPGSPTQCSHQRPSGLSVARASAGADSFSRIRARGQERQRPASILSATPSPSRRVKQQACHVTIAFTPTSRATCEVTVRASML